MLDYINKLNRSKYFLGFFIIFLNLGSKFITIRMNDYHERVLRDTVGRELMIFAICFVGTRDILASILMSSLFIILNDYLFDEKSAFCIIPRKYRHKMKAAIDTNKDDIIDESEIKHAINILNKAQKQKEKEIQRNAYMTFMNNL
jgi:hypothetical protein